MSWNDPKKLLIDSIYSQSCMLLQMERCQSVLGQLPCSRTPQQCPGYEPVHTFTLCLCVDLNRRPEPSPSRLSSDCQEKNLLTFCCLRSLFMQRPERRRNRSKAWFLWVRAGHSVLLECVCVCVFHYKWAPKHQ